VSEGPADGALVERLARVAVTQAAPEELPLFRPISEAYAKDPGSLEQDGSGDQMLGFGVEMAAVLVTPVALRVSRDVLDFVVEHVRGRVRTEGAAAIDGVIDRVLRRKEGGAPAAAPEDDLGLTGEQLEHVHALALEKAQLLKLPPATAELLADALVGSLATE
jgi:hypothetical protein